MGAPMSVPEGLGLYRTSGSDPMTRASCIRLGTDMGRFSVGADLGWLRTLSVRQSGST